MPLETKKQRMTPHQRLEHAMDSVIHDAINRLRIRRIYENELKEAHIFWDEKTKTLEFVSDHLELVIRER